MRAVSSSKLSESGSSRSLKELLNMSWWSLDWLSSSGLRFSYMFNNNYKFVV